jgi:hypothetical protein
MFAFLKLNHAVKKNDFSVHDFVYSAAIRRAFWRLLKP